MKHQKHSKITRKINDIYAPNEISILGAKCSLISNLVSDLSEILATKYKIAYLDASHAEDNDRQDFDTFTFHKKGALVAQKKVNINVYNERVRFNEYDLTFINGNHYEGKKQIVFLDPEKESSILKRIDQINDVICFVAINKNYKIFNCLIKKFENHNDIPFYSIEEAEKISQEILKCSEMKSPSLNGLVLIGGKSERMGKDKAALKYYNKEHSIFLADLLNAYTENTFLSVKDSGVYDYPIIKDRFIELGPFGAICSAFLNNPNEAYFVLATDLPFINEELIELLIQNRDSTKIATTVKGKSKDFPEPLITIWEPKAYPILLNYLAQGISCPRKVLINSEVKIIEVADKLITNVNTPEEFSQIKEAL